MHKDRIRIYVFGGLFVLILLALIVLQYHYYQDIVILNKKQLRYLAQQSLSDAIQEEELSLFTELLQKKLEGDHSFHQKVISRELSKTIFKELKDFRELGGDSTLCLGKHKKSTAHDQRFKEDLLLAYFRESEKLDKYILEYLYDIYHHRLISMYVQAPSLADKVRDCLDKYGIANKFIIDIKDDKGCVQTSYIEPTMLRNSVDTLSGIEQRLYSLVSPSETSYLDITLILNYEQNTQDSFYFILPGLIYMIITIVLGIIFIVYLLRELSFQSVKTSFMNNMAHELKTPISSIQLALQSLCNESANASDTCKRKELVHIMNQEVKRLGLLVDKTLQFSLMKTKKYHMQMKVLDLYDIILPIIDIYTLRVEQFNGSLNYDDDVSNSWVKVDALHMKNIFFNIFDNAIKYRRTDQDIQINVSMMNTQDNVLVIIEDNGIGVEKDQLKKIFKRFYRVPTGKLHSVKGLGIGLSYVSEIIHVFNGSVEAQQSSLGGLRVIITLPLVIEEIEN